MQDAPIVSIHGSTTIHNSVFIGNTGQVSVISSESSGDVSLSMSCFVDNNGDLGTVSLDAASSLVENDANFGLRNVLFTGDCDGIGVEGLACVPFPAPQCRSSLAENVNFFALYSDCLLNYTEISAALAADQDDIEVVLCPGANLNLTTPIRIRRSETTLKCGESGSRINECVLSGGVRQLEVLDPVEDVVIQGLTFRGATESSVFVDTVSPLSIQFVDCAWEVSYSGV